MDTVQRIVRRVAAVALLGSCLPSVLPALGQSVVEGQFEAHVNTETNQLEVSLALRITPKTEFGSATLRFTYNPAALAIPSGSAVNARLDGATDYEFLPVTNTAFNSTERLDAQNIVTVNGNPVPTTNYRSTTLTRPVENEISVNIVLSSWGSGIPLPEVAGTFTPILTVYFDILDPAQPAELAWRTEGPNATAIFEADNVTPMELGTFTGSSVPLPVEGAVDVPDVYLISPAYPNPFREQARLTLAVAQAQHVAVHVYDLLGRRVAHLHEGRLEANRHYAFVLDGGGLSSGIYLIRVTGAHFSAVRPVTLLR